jgi:hypothetical protein
METASCQHSGAYNLKWLIGFLWTIFVALIYVMFEMRAVVKVNAAVFLNETPCGFLKGGRAAVCSVEKYRVYKKNLIPTGFV